MSLEINVSDFVNANQATLADMCHSNKRRFHIPMNQRPWSWKKNQLQELWEDILKTAKHYYDVDSLTNPWKQRNQPTGEPHFIGAFVFVEKDTNTLEVFDGQQRLTAISMVVSAIRQIAQELAQNGSTVDIQTNSQTLVTRLTRWLQADPDPGEHRPRIVVDGEFIDLFDALVVKPHSISQRNTMVDALGLDFKELVNHRKLRDGTEYVGTLVSDYLTVLPEQTRYDAVVGLSNVIESCLLCIWSSVKDDSFAFDVFKCLNAKGMPLSDADKIKNELFLHSNKKDYGTIKTCWDEIYRNVPLGHISGYLRFRHAALKGECQEAKVYVTIRDEEIVPGPVVQVVDEWKKDSELMSTIALKGGLTLKPKTKEILETFRTLRISLAQIFLLAAAKKFLPGQEDNFQKAAILCLNFCFRVLTISSKDTTFLESKLGLSARSLTNGTKLVDIAKEFAGASTDSEFREDFAVAAESRTKVQYYILYELESYLGGASGLVPAPHSPNQNIEHILPRNLSKAASRASEWAWARKDPEKHKLYINRIGNLCVLEGPINQQVSNYDFSAKQTGSYPGSAKNYKGNPRKSYPDSKLNMVAELADVTKHPKWSFAAIEKRQVAMAKLATKVWPLTVPK